MKQSELSLISAPCGQLQTNCYVLTNASDEQSIVVDPGAEPDKIFALLNGRPVMAILITHGHGDHIGAVADVQAATGAPVYIHPADASMLGSIQPHGSLNDDSMVTFGQHRLRIVHTPGHTAGQVSILLPDDRALVGDTIFEGGPGKTWSADGFRTTLHTLKNTVLTWPDNTVCYPGHGTPFRLGDIRSAVEAFVARQHPHDFYGDATWEMS